MSWHFGNRRPGCRSGLCRLSTEEKARDLLNFSVHPTCTESINRADLNEPYDLAEHERLISEHPMPSAWETPS